MTLAHPTPDTLALNAVEATCECNTYMWWNPATGVYEHTNGCPNCWDPRSNTRTADTVDCRHTCDNPIPVTCAHDRCMDRVVGPDVADDGQPVLTLVRTIASVHAVCGDDLPDCCGRCGCLPEDDYSPDDSYDD